jgi:hypothetical protein
VIEVSLHRPTFLRSNIFDLHILDLEFCTGHSGTIAPAIDRLSLSTPYDLQMRAFSGTFGRRAQRRGNGKSTVNTLPRNSKSVGAS